jgi:NAD(P)-dependent dehydrogenase (short-subunit alcohol dehydrogenase family)
VTGANSGIGRETALELASRGARVFLASRSEHKTQPVMDEIVAETGNSALEFLALDLGDLASVRACASEFLRTGEPLHGLINNAGLAGQRGMTESGFELAFGTNYVGPFLLTGLLLERLRQSAPARIVNVSSIGHYRAPGIDYEAVRRRPRVSPGCPNTPSPSSATCSTHRSWPGDWKETASPRTRCTPGRSQRTCGAACHGQCVR